MDINKCKSCKHYVPFIDGCDLSFEEVYLGDGDFEDYPMYVTYIKK